MITPGIDLSHTPGIYYAIAYWLGCTFFIWHNPKRLTGWKLGVAHVLFFVAIAAFMVATDGISREWFLPCVAFYVFLMLLFIKVCCDIDWAKAGYFCARSFIMGEFAASLEWQLLYFGLTDMKLPMTLTVDLVFLIGIHSVVFLVMYLSERKYTESYGTLRITWKEVWSVIAMCVAVFAVSNLSFSFKDSPFSSQFTAEIFIIRTLVDLGGLTMLYAYHGQLQALQVKTEVERLQGMLQMYYANYRMSEESIALVNKKYHDLKHQIKLLRSELQSEEKLAYLDQMEQEIQSYEAQNKTGNQVLDTILTADSVKCQRLGIRMTCVADGKLLDFMNAMDLSALFGNALDNAIESVSKISDPEKRLIHVSVVRQKNFLRIRVENCYEGDIRFRQGVPVTTKDANYHGFGLKSMQQTVEKYNGSMTVHAKEGWFELRILFPLSH